MLKKISWLVTSRLAVAVSILPDALYFRILNLVLTPLLRLAGTSLPVPVASSSMSVLIDTTEQLADTAQRPESMCPSKPSIPAAAAPMARVHALVIDGFVPTPDKDAASVNIYWFMRILLSLGYDVTFVSAFTPRDSGRYTKALRALGIICPRVSSASEYIATHAATFDLVALYRVSVAGQLFDQVRRDAPGARVIFNTVDLHFLRDQRQAELAGDLNAFVEAKRREEIELRLICSADATIILSRFELDYVERHAPGGNYFLVPLTVPVVRSLTPYEDRAGVLFVGGFSHAPNGDAVHFLCNEIWPLVRELLPDARLYVAGADPPNDIAAHHAPDKGIEILGHVEDLSGLCGAVRVAVAPLRFGAGLKGKVVTSLAAGLPCVVTSIASEGMPDGAASVMITADEPCDFARAIARVHTNAEIWSQMSNAGIRYSQMNFSVEATTKRLRTLLRALVLPAGHSAD